MSVASSTSLFASSASSSLPYNEDAILEGQEPVTIEQFMHEGKLNKIGAGFDVRVVANPDFPSYVVKEYDCKRCNLKYLFDNEISAIRAIAERLRDEKLSRVVFPSLYESKTNGEHLFEMFPRIYPPSATSSEDTGEMFGVCFSKESHHVNGEYHHAGRGQIYEPQRLKDFFHEEVPNILKELGKAFALLHFKAFMAPRDIEVVIGKSAPSGPLKLFLIDFDRAVMGDFHSKEDFEKKYGTDFSFSMYYKFQQPFGKSFSTYLKVEEEFKKPFVDGYLETAETLGFRSEAEAIVEQLG